MGVSEDLGGRHLQQQILMPVGHVIMWSVPHLFLDKYDLDRQDKLMVYVGGQAPTDLVWTGTATVTPDPALHTTTSVFVQTVQKRIAKFRLIFSFHKVRIFSSKA